MQPPGAQLLTGNLHSALREERGEEPGLYHSWRWLASSISTYTQTHTDTLAPVCADLISPSWVQNMQQSPQHKNDTQNIRIHKVVNK